MSQGILQTEAIRMTFFFKFMFQLCFVYVIISDSAGSVRERRLK